MAQPPVAVLDTDILSAIMKRHPGVQAKAAEYLSHHGRLTICAITRFEILRGLFARKASAQMKIFDSLCSQVEVLPITDMIIVEAARIYGDLHQRGQLISDADTLIAACALSHGRGVITNNEDHFRRIPGLEVQNWLR